MDRKGLVGLAAFGIIIVVLALAATAIVFTAEQASAMGADLISINNGIPTVVAPSSSKMINITIANMNTSANITMVNITIPGTFIYVTNSQVTNKTGSPTLNFSNTSVNTLLWNVTGTTGYSLVGLSSAINFSFKVELPNWLGTYNITVWTTDNFSAVNITNVTVTVLDTSVPSASNFTYNRTTGGATTYLNTTYYTNFSSIPVIINVTAHAVVNGTFSAQLNVSNINNTQVILTNMTFVTNLSTGNDNYTITFNPNDYPDGFYNLTVIVRSWADNVNGTGIAGAGNLSAYIAIDRQPPNVTIVAPISGNTYGGKLYFNTTVFDNLLPVDAVLFNLTNVSGTFGVNTSYVSLNNSKGYGLEVNTNNLQVGNYVLKIIANDTKNNINNTENVTFGVDRFVVVIDTPVNASNVSTTSGIVFGIHNYTFISGVNFTMNTTSFGSLLPNSQNFTIKAGNFTNSTWQQMQNITIRFNDTIGNLNSTTVSFVVDNGYSMIYNRTYVANTSDAGQNLSGTVNMYVTANETISGVHSAWLVLTNTTAVYATVNFTQYSSNYNSTDQNLSLSTTNYPDGLYNLTYWARGWNDLVNSTNTSDPAWVWIDNNNPIVNVSLSTTAITQGSTIVISCASSDLGYGIANKTCTVLKPTGTTVSCPNTGGGAFTDTSALGIYTATCSATDYVGKTSTASVVFAAVSGGGNNGGGGGGGGGGTTSSSTTDSFVVSTITGGTQYTFNISKDIDVTQVIVKPVNDSTSVELTASKYTDMPSGVLAAPPGIVYSYLSITVANLPNNNIQKATITFRIPRTWIASNSIDITTVRLNRYSNSIWTQLTTAQTSTDANYVYFSADTPGFSYFAITAQALAPPAGGGGVQGQNCTTGNKQCSGSILQECINSNWVTSQNCQNGCNSTSLACNTQTPAPPAPSADYLIWIIGIVVIVIIVVLIYVFIVR